jgi:GntR family transcriptional regulator
MTSDKPETEISPGIVSGPFLPGGAPVGFRPLYRQVKDAFVKRMVDGVWPAGFLLPSENQLAQEIGVSQGTVRKALDELASENLLVRQQGRGTFVAQHDEKRILFQFFKLVPDDGIARFPESEVLSASVHLASEIEREQLALEPGARVARVRRMRAIADVPMIVETLSLPDAMFPGITEGPVPNSLYAFYAERFGVTIAHAREKLKAIALPAEEAGLLNRPAGHPALMVQRLALSLDVRPVEWRVSLCLTDDAHYVSFMR